jgi:hypothetical protein
MTHEPRPEGRIVEAANFGSRFEADSAIALLEANGIEAMAKGGRRTSGCSTATA